MLRPQSKALGVRSLLAVLLTIPLVAVAWLSGGAIITARDQARQGTLIQNQSEAVRELSMLSSALVTEASWGGTASALQDFGLSLDVVNQLTGIDVAAAYQQARVATDRAAADRASDELLNAIDRARVDVDKSRPWRVSESYIAVLTMADETVLAELETLALLVDSAPAGTEIGQSMRVLSETIQLRRYTSDISLGSFSARYPNLAEPGQAVAGLLSGIIGRSTTAANLDRLVTPGTGMQSAWTTAENDPAVADFLQAADAGFDQIVTNGENRKPSANAPLDLEVERTNFDRSLTVIELHAGLVDVAVDDLLIATDRMRSDAASDQVHALLSVLGALVLALAGAYLGGRWLTRPLRSLAAVVDRMRGGELSGQAEVIGPREVRAAAMALNEAADHLRLAENQAAALAEEDLDNPVLAQAAPGLLGRSLQQAVAGLTQSLAQREEYRRRLSHEASHDSLTGLPNRSSIFTGLEQALYRAERSGEHVAVFFIDLDGFKQINDTAGHATGDRMLIMAADRIAGAIRTGDVVGRIGGDEFVVVAEPVADIDGAVEIAARMLDALCRPAVIDGDEFPAGASIGVALAAPGALTADEVLHDADLAVYRAKERGRYRYEICDVDLREAMNRRQQAEDRLRRAVENNEIELVYFPACDAEDDCMIGLEARPRWAVDNEQPIADSEFNRLLERTNLLREVERWTIDRVLDQLARWSDHELLSSLPIAVEMSHGLLTTPSLVTDLSAAIADRGLAPSRLVVEVDEAELLTDLEAVSARMAELRAAGFRVAVDGFGRQFESLAVLRNVSLDRITVDPTLVTVSGQDVDTELLSRMVEAARLLSATVVVKGLDHRSDRRPSLTRARTADQIESDLGPRIDS